MRGGTANVSVIISDRSIGSPVIDAPNVLLALNLPSLDMFEDRVTPDGLVVVNTSMIPRCVIRQDLTVIFGSCL
jgi:Pyruvate/2-oxoacid:ferredoxin oxidoreductase gamma subunit